MAYFESTKACFESKFKYCPLLWIFHGRQINNKVNRVHERALRMIYEDITFSFDGLLKKGYVIFCSWQKDLIAYTRNVQNHMVLH